MLALNIRALVGRLDDTARTAFDAAGHLCASRGHRHLEIEHYLINLFEPPSSEVLIILEHFGIDRPRLIRELGTNLSRLPSTPKRTPGISSRLRVLLRDSWCLASLNFAVGKIGCGHILLALAVSDDLQWAVPDELLRLDGARLAAEMGTILAGFSGKAPVEPVRTGTPRLEASSKRGDISVFLCYRREDSEAYAGRLCDFLERELGQQTVFMDIDRIEPGEVFQSVIEERVAACDVLVVLIGKRWLKATDARGRRRLDDELDWVRRETAVALSLDKRVVPCLLGGAKMPAAAHLPPVMAGLAARHAIEISQKTFKRDTQILLNLLKRFQTDPPHGVVGA